MNFLRRPAFLTGVFLLLLLGLISLRAHHWRLPATLSSALSRGRPAAATPEDTVYAMLDAARSGNTEVYLANFSGLLQQQIQQAARDSGKVQFAQYLNNQSSGFQSVALSISEQPSDSEARLRVEYVFTNRNEVQTFHLKKNPGGWKIVGISSTDQIKTLIPYGTAVTDD